MSVNANGCMRMVESISMSVIMTTTITKSMSTIMSLSEICASKIGHLQLKSA